MSGDAIKALQRIRGIGPVLAQRLAAAGVDSYAKVAAAGETGLGAFPGLQVRLIPSILAQAQALAEEQPAQRPATADGGDLPAEPSAAEGKREALQDAVDQLRERVRALLAQPPAVADGTAREATARRLDRAVGKFHESLRRVETMPSGRLKKARKRLAKAERRLAALSGAAPEKLVRGLKKARRPLKRIVA